MKLNVYAVYDGKVGLFAKPMFLRSDGEALRPFMMQCENEETPLNKWPEDYTLHRLGTYSEETGEMITESPPALVAKAIDYHPRNRPVSHNPSSEIPPQISQKLKELQAQKGAH